MVKSQLSGGAQKRFRDILGIQTHYIQHQTSKPKHYPCPQCGKKGKRKQVIIRRIPHIATLHRRAWIVAKVGVYKARCACCKYFQAPIPGVPYRGRYSYEVRNTVANALIRDRMPYGLVIRRMQEDYCLTPRSRGQAEPHDICSGGEPGYGLRPHSAMMLPRKLPQEVHHGSVRTANSSCGTLALSPGSVTASGGRHGYRPPSPAPSGACP